MRPIIFRKLIVSPIVRYFLRVGYDISCSGERDTCYARIIGGPFQQLLADIFLRRARFLNASEMGARNEKGIDVNEKRGKREFLLPDYDASLIQVKLTLSSSPPRFLPLIKIIEEF